MGASTSIATLSSRECGMNRCTNSPGSSTAKLLATVNRTHTTRAPCSSELRRTQWKLFRACQSRNLSSTRGETSRNRPLKVNDGADSESATGLVDLSGNAASARNGASVLETSEVDIDPRSSPKDSASVTAIDLPEEKSRPAFIRRPLPLSPLMDPSFLEARGRHHAPKGRPRKNLTPFQQQLAKNPYALALASPVRRCAISGTKLPSFFLQGFRVMSDPTTGEPWYVPADLANKHLPAKKRDALDEVEEVQESEELNCSESNMGKGHLAGSKGLESGMEVDEKPRPSKMGYQAYTLNSKFLLSGMVDTTSGSKRTNKGKAGQTKFIPGGWRSVRSAMQTYGKASWRPDMDDFVTMLMGRRISEALLYLAKQKRGYIVGCKDWEDALKKPQVAAFLWTGSASGDILTGPPEFATLDVGSQDFGDVGPQLAKKKRKVPIYNLAALLGKENMDELRKSVPNSVFEKEVLVLKHKNATIELESRLWKLQGYVAEYHDDQVAPAGSSPKGTQADEIADLSKDLPLVGFHRTSS